MKRRVMLKTAAALLAFSTCTSSWAASVFPDSTFRIVIGQAAGGAVDAVARLLAGQLSQSLGQSVVIENRPGAGGMVAGQATAQAVANGYTLGMLDVGTLAVNPVLQKQIAYDAEKDFVYLGAIAKIPLVLVAHPSVQANDLQSLTGYIKANPGKLSYASSGVGSPLHLAMESYKQDTGVDVTHIPFQGGAPALTSLVGGHVQLMFIDLNLAAEYAEGGKLKLIAIATQTRQPRLPDLPTFDESGIAGFEFAPWVGLVGPAKMPQQAVDRLSADLAQAMSGDALPERIRALGFEPFQLSGQDFAAFSTRERANYVKLINDTGIQLGD